MNAERAREGERVAEIFLDTIPPDVFDRLKEKNLHHQLAYFYCWVEEMKQIT